jgi:hypothetical protein
MLRSALLACLSPLIVSASTPDFRAIISPSLAVVKIECGDWMGSGFRIDQHTIVSVNHVVKNHECSIGGWPVRITHSAAHQDFAIIEGNAGPALPVDCGGFVAGRKYLAIGFARDVDPPTTIELTGTGAMDNGEAVLSGMLAVIPGMSGGAIISADTHKVVGTVNSENFEAGLSWSVPLKGTVVCGGTA